jgi:hypothetical protein
LVTLAATTTVRVWGATNANNAEAISGQCSIQWVRVNPVL